ncbi:mobile element protein [Asticcacaulis excentricus]|uniref:Mobile element protein n=1 Tax=Asticcacaulis excentricus TaxID=78587 RepID=A0A3G9G3N6_9CAUL|nr:hypothetical protein [Asticcacaulis excentricus]BBF81357.1 mobile element protein [Asticcacaulis excentricus]
MQNALKPSNLVPAGFEVVNAVTEGAATIVTVRDEQGQRLSMLRFIIRTCPQPVLSPCR